MASVGSAVQDGCDKLRQQAIALAVNDTRSPLHGVNPADVVVWNGRLRLKSNPARGETYQQLLSRNQRTHLEIGVKGLGEIVQVGVAPAIANAVFHATGIRIRDLPITAEALL